MTRPDPYNRMRKLVENEMNAKGRVITITSGKGGVGKTNVALNLGIALAARQKKVVIFDADTRLSNIDILVGKTPGFSIKDVILGEKSMADVVTEIYPGLELVSVGTRDSDLEAWEDDIKEQFLGQIFQMRLTHDFVLIDTSAGLTRMVVDFSLRADEIFVVTTPEPTAISDAYALIKLLNEQKTDLKFRTLINFVTNREEAEEVYERFCLVAERFLNIRPELIGFIETDSDMRKAVYQQKPLMTAFPHSRCAKNINEIAARIIA